MNEPDLLGCDSCGLWRLCFPGRVANAPGAAANGLRIRRMRLARGNALFRAGVRVESFFMVRSGCIKELDDSSGDRGAVLNFALPGEMLSLQSLCGAPSPTTAVAVVPSHVCVVSGGAFARACAQSPEASAELIRLIARTATAARDLLTLTRDKDASERVFGFLMNIRDRLEERGMQGRDFRLTMNRSDIANYLGLRSETVSRCFTELEARELIQVRAKRVQILKPAPLKQAATA
jgi:CRP/FNR family transcriptional regulator, anaerobic regulatory protein